MNKYTKIIEGIIKEKSNIATAILKRIKNLIEHQKYFVF